MQSYIKETQNFLNAHANSYMLAELAMMQELAKFYWTTFNHMDGLWGYNSVNNQMDTAFEHHWKKVCTRDDFLIQGKTSESPISNWFSNDTFSSAVAAEDQIIANFAAKYCICEENGTNVVNDCISNENGTWNELSAELNRETANQCCSTDELDAKFLFPINRKDSMTGTAWISQEWSRDLHTDGSIDKIHKIFNVCKVPKVAFKMISRWDLARRHEKDDEEVQDNIDEEPSDAFEKRKAAFGTKRDDLFYKTIGRDVRKYLQEQFQCSLNSKNLKECLRNGTFLKEFKQFFKNEFSSDLTSSVDDSKVFCWVASLVSYQAYTPFCDENNKELSLKIHDSLHNFTKAKLIDMCKLPEFKWVFKYYSKKINSDNFKRFMYHRTMKTNVKGYKYAFNDILKQWD